MKQGFSETEALRLKWLSKERLWIPKGVTSILMVDIYDYVVGLKDSMVLIREVSSLLIGFE